AVESVARAMHPDETPAIHGVEAAAVTEDYLAWAHSETATPGGATRNDASSTSRCPESGRLRSATHSVCRLHGLPQTTLMNQHLPSSTEYIRRLAGPSC